jgi:hypothetical protein
MALPTWRRKTVRLRRRSIRPRLSRSTDNEEQQRVTTTDRYYTRWGNPTITLAEQTIAELEGTDAARTFASGMGAITSTIMAFLKAGDHIVSQQEVYGGVAKFFTQWLPKMGIETTFVDTTDYEQYEKAIRKNTKLLYLESPTNPALRVVDFKKRRDAGQEARAHQSDRQHVRHAHQSAAGGVWHRSGNAFGHEISERARRLNLWSGLRTPGVDGSTLGDADDAGQLHGSARGMDADPRPEDAGRPRGAPERECAARRGIFEPTRKSSEGALSVS